MPPRVSRKITCLQFVCALMIVGLHTAFATYFPGSPEWAVSVNKVCRSVFDAAISTFFTLSALLTYWKAETQRYPALLKRRLRTLALPYLLWSVLHLLVNVARRSMANGVLVRLDAMEVSRLLTVDAVNGIFWFLRVLMVFVLLYPAILWCVRRKWPAIVLFVAALVAATLGWVPYSCTVYWIPHYLMGAWVGVHARETLQGARRPRWTRLAAAALLVGLAACRPLEGALHYLYWLPAPALMWLLTDGFASDKPLPWWVGASFYLYCSHLLVERYAVRLYLAVMGRGTVAFLLGNALLPLLCAAIALLAGAAVRKLLPGVYAAFTGGRAPTGLLKGERSVA